MNIAQKYFMVVVKEQSLTRAAEKLYLSPQNLGNHIHRLEKEYGTLFLRKPRFRLTAAGEALFETLQQISVLEKSLSDHIQSLQAQGGGQLRIGIHATRARVLLPQIVPKYRACYPNVFLDFIYQDLETLEQMLEVGELDMLFGVDCKRKPSFLYLQLQQEPIYFAASRNLLRKCGIAQERTSISEQELALFPFLLSPPHSSFRKKIDSYCEKYGLVLQESMRISDFELQLILAAQDIGACFCPQMLLKKLETYSEVLVSLPVEGLHFTNDLCLVTHKLAYQTDELKAFIKLFQQIFNQ